VIPHLIHQIWLQGIHALPADYAAGARTWKERNPGWEHRIWDEASLLELMQTRAPEWLPQYEAQPEFIARADVARYMLMQLLGGAYADMDTECRRPIAPLLEGSKSRLHFTVYTKLRRAEVMSNITNSIMACEPGHPMWSIVRERIAMDPNVWLLMRTGPCLLQSVLRDVIAANPDDVRLIFFPDIYTAAFAPTFFMRFVSRQSRNYALDFNHSGRIWMTDPVPQIVGLFREKLKAARARR
jgi:mannosyltransferase OCH1-like enzyme